MVRDGNQYEFDQFPNVIHKFKSIPIAGFALRP